LSVLKQAGKCHVACAVAVTGNISAVPVNCTWSGLLTEQCPCFLAVMHVSPPQAISQLPEYVHVGLITFGTHVHVYEIGFTELSKCYVFRGAKEYTAQQVGPPGWTGHDMHPPLP
jgi:hypothetical protein